VIYESFADQRGVSAAKVYALRTMIALTIFVQLRDKVMSVLELLIEGKFMLKELGIRSLRALAFFTLKKYAAEA